MIWLAVPNPPVAHPATYICSGSAYFCEVNYASLISTGISIVLTLAFGFWVASRVQSRTPGKFQMVFELLINYTRTLIRDTVGEQPPFVLPLALTLFFYILIANWIGFFPLPAPLAPANTDINQTLAMAIVVFIASQVYAIRVRGLGGYFKHYMRPEGMSKAVQIAFIPLNVIEEIVKPVTLSLRLMGNIFGGIIMLWVLTALISSLPIPAVPYAVSTILVIIWKLFDVFFVGTLQAFIFFLLTIIYFGQAREGVEEEEHGHGAAQAVGISPVTSQTS